MALLGAMAFNAHAETIDFSTLSAQDKEAIGKIAKDYLVANPEVLIEMSNGLKAKQEQAQADQYPDTTKVLNRSGQFHRNHSIVALIQSAKACK